MAGKLHAVNALVKGRMIRQTFWHGVVGFGPGDYMNTRLNMNMITTLLEMPGYRVVRHLGMVRGIVVRSRSIFGTIGASLQTIVGGNISLYTDMCEKTREDALELMMQHAAEHGANAVLGVRYDANEVMQGVTEVLAYGSAVVVEPNA
jgi:uncharacterized protein YbjQ (UPF0145 family)